MENTNIIETMAAELEHLRPMEASLEMAEADCKGYLARIKELEAEVKELKAEITDIVNSATSMLRDPNKCRGLDLDSPLGKIANVAFKHWRNVEQQQAYYKTVQNSLETRLRQIQELRAQKAQAEEDAAFWKAKAKEKWDKEPKAVRDEFFRKVLVYGADLVRVEDAFILAKDNRRLERALWLARAARAHAEWGHWATIWFCDTRAILNINESSVSQDPYRCTIIRNAAEWRNLWANVESKCRAKAEEYK